MLLNLTRKVAKAAHKVRNPARKVPDLAQDLRNLARKVRDLSRNVADLYQGAQTPSTPKTPTPNFCGGFARGANVIPPRAAEDSSDTNR